MTATEWPNNVVDVLVEELDDMQDVKAIVDRPLEPEDANQSVGVYVSRWVPPQDAWEIGNIHPTLGVYTVNIDILVKGMDRVATRRLMAQMTKRLRAMLYVDDQLQVRLGALSETEANLTETYKRHRVTQQDYSTGQLGDTHLSASTTTVTVETENR